MRKHKRSPNPFCVSSLKCCTVFEIVFPTLYGYVGAIVSNAWHVASLPCSLTTTRQNDFRSARHTHNYARGFCKPRNGFSSSVTFSDITHEAILIFIDRFPSGLNETVWVGVELTRVFEYLKPRPVMAQQHFRAHNDLLCVCVYASLPLSLSLACVRRSHFEKRAAEKPFNDISKVALDMGRQGENSRR